MRGVRKTEYNCHHNCTYSCFHDLALLYKSPVYRLLPLELLPDDLLPELPDELLRDELPEDLLDDVLGLLEAELPDDLDEVLGVLLRAEYELVRDGVLRLTEVLEVLRVEELFGLLLMILVRELEGEDERFTVDVVFGVLLVFLFVTVPLVLRVFLVTVFLVLLFGVSRVVEIFRDFLLTVSVDEPAALLVLPLSIDVVLRFALVVSPDAVFPVVFISAFDALVARLTPVSNPLNLSDLRLLGLCAM